mmetsp:Transcript_25618/g.84345  ORF Transcript_25618/g.84345 Transcript_25618/m.84345 type:complete len:409 (-) Transcript_25618:1633-2859(-)
MPPPRPGLPGSGGWRPSVRQIRLALVGLVIGWTVLETVRFTRQLQQPEVIEERYVSMSEAPPAAPIRVRPPRTAGTAKVDGKGVCKSKCTAKRDCAHLDRVWTVLEGKQQALRAGGPLFRERAKQKPEALTAHQRMFRVPSEEGVGLELQDITLNLNAEKSLSLPKQVDLTKELLEELPEEEATWQFRTCAVVGNSGLLKKSDLGAEIDSHDAVFRINYAPIKGFSKDVGKRTTFDVVSAAHTKAFVPEAEAPDLALPKALRGARRNSTVVVFDILQKVPRTQLYVPFLRKLMRQQTPVAVLSPGMVVHAHQVWSRFRQASVAGDGNYKTHGPKPMSGFFAAIFAAQVCETTHLYGFSQYQRFSSKYGKFHYFDKEDATISDQSFPLGFDILSNIERWPCSDAKLAVH